MSRVTSMTCWRTAIGIRFRASRTTPESVPETIATIAPLRDDSVQLPVAQARLVNAQPLPDVLRKDEPSVGVVFFRPSQVAAQVFLVLPLELVPVYVVWTLKTPCRYRVLVHPVVLSIHRRRLTTRVTFLSLIGKSLIRLAS